MSICFLLELSTLLVLCTIPVSIHKRTVMGHGARKVWRHILWYLINLCIANAYIVSKEVSNCQTKANYDHMAFRLELAHELISKFNGRKRAIQD